MSYEGYIQYLCEAGHYWDKSDCGYNEDDINCPVCNASVVWSNMVDVTNGSFDTNPETGKEERIDGYIELEIKEQKVCEHCKSILETKYKIPEKTNDEEA